MRVLVKGAGTQNKGAYLMFCVLMDLLRERWPGHRVTVPPRRIRNAVMREHDVDACDLYYSRKLHNLSPGLERFVGALYTGGQEVVGIDVQPPEDIDVVLDISGYAYGDKWGSYSLEVANWIRRRTQAGTYVLLPQTFGPFEQAKVRREAARFFPEVTKIVARDAKSREFVASVGVEPGRVVTAPDLTYLVEAEAAGDGDRTRDRAVLVPNKKMVEHGSADTYEMFLHRAGTSLQRHFDDVVVLIHGGADDRDLGRSVSARLGLEMIERADPADAKKELAGAELVVASRYHALVGALSSGVLAIGTSWAHKYEELYREYGLEELLVSPTISADALDDMVGEIARPETREALRSEVGRIAARKRMRVREVVLETLDAALDGSGAARG